MAISLKAKLASTAEALKRKHLSHFRRKINYGGNNGGVVFMSRKNTEPKIISRNLNILCFLNKTDVNIDKVKTIALKK